MKVLYNDITIAIVLYQESYEIVSKCLSSLENFNIIIIDNSQNYKLKKKVIKNFKIFKYIINKKNLGFSKATNQAIRLINTEYVLSLEADCIIKIHDIFKLYQGLNKYNDCIIVAPTLYNEKNELTWSGGPLPEKNIEMKTLELNGDTCVDIVNTAAILYRKRDLLDLGLFDEDFFIYFPDFELGRRIKKIHKTIIQIHDARAIHEMGNLKINNIIKKTFFRNYYFTLDELIYYQKEKAVNLKYYNLKKKIVKLIFRVFLNLLIFRLVKSTKHVARILAFFKFRSLFIKDKKI